MMNKKLNNNIVLYKDKESQLFLLKPILLVEDNLLTPLSLNNFNSLEAISISVYIFKDILNFYNDKKEFSLILYFLNIELNKPIIFCDGIIKGYLNKDKKLIQLNKYIMKQNYLAKDLKNMSGIYAFIHKNNKDCYIGSSINIGNRFNAHKSFNNSYTPFAIFLKNNNGLQDMNFGPIYCTTDYFLKFKTLFPNYNLSKGEGFFLLNITDLHNKILEQTMINRLKPNLNVMNKVAFNYNDWRKEWLNIYFEESSRNKNVLSISYAGRSSVEQYKKHNKILIYFLLTEDEINLLPINLKNNVEKIFKDENDAVTVNYVSRRYEISKEIVFKNINTLNYIKSPVLRRKMRLQDTTFCLKNKPLLISDKDYNTYIYINRIKIKLFSILT